MLPARRSSSRAERLRQAYLEFLTAAYKADPKFEELVKGSFARIAQKKTKAAVIDAEFKGLARTKSDNPFARAFTDRLRMHKAIELSVVTLSDVEEIACPSSRPHLRTGKSELDFAVYPLMYLFILVACGIVLYLLRAGANAQVRNVISHESG